MNIETERHAPDDARQATLLLDCLGGLDLTSADGRAGLTALLAELERQAPGALQRLQADIAINRAARRHPEAVASVQ